MPITLLADHFSILRDKIDSISNKREICSQNLKNLRATAFNTKQVEGLPIQNRVKDLSPRRRYLRKKSRTLVYKELFRNDPDFVTFFNWIKYIQTKLNLTDHQFAQVLGLKDARMLRAYYRMERFPSIQTYERLIVLERQARIKITEVNKIINIRNKGITKVIEIPKMRNAAFILNPQP